MTKVFWNPANSIYVTDDGDELFLRNSWPTKSLISGRNIVRDIHLRKSPTNGEQDLQLLKTRVQAYNTALQILDIGTFQINGNVDTKWA